MSVNSAFNPNIYGTKILDALTAAGASTVTFSSEPYLGLFTTMPNEDFTGGEEPTGCPEYQRIPLNAKGLNNLKLMKAATVTTAEVQEVDEDGNIVKSTKQIATVENQERIYWPEAESAAMGTLVGIGVFASKTAATPFLMANFKTPIEVAQYQIPMIRIGDFIQRLK